jgi:hypothetical protein
MYASWLASFQEGVTTHRKKKSHSNKLSLAINRRLPFLERLLQVRRQTPFLPAHPKE